MPGQRREHAKALLRLLVGLDATVPAALLEVLDRILAVLLLAFLASVVPIEQSTGSGDFEEDHFARVFAVKVDGRVDEGVAEDRRN